MWRSVLKPQEYIETLVKRMSNTSHENSQDTSENADEPASEPKQSKPSTILISGELTKQSAQILLFLLGGCQISVRPGDSSFDDEMQKIITAKNELKAIANA
jgi:hypothetical protein